MSTVIWAIIAFYDQIDRQRDAYRSAHGGQVSKLSEHIARTMGLSEAEIITLKAAASLHDVGKVSMPDTLIYKPGRFNQLERFAIQRHTVSGLELLQHFQFGEVIEDVIIHHHERYDGKGYPHGLKGDQISIHAGIVHIADVYDALTNERSYRPLIFSSAEALDMIHSERSAYNPAVLEAFVETIKRNLYEDP